MPRRRGAPRLGISLQKKFGALRSSWRTGRVSESSAPRAGRRPTLRPRLGLPRDPPPVPWAGGETQGNGDEPRGGSGRSEAPLGGSSRRAGAGERVPPSPPDQSFDQGTGEVPLFGKFPCSPSESHFVRSALRQGGELLRNSTTSTSTQQHRHQLFRDPVLDELGVWMSSEFSSSEFKPRGGVSGAPLIGERCPPRGRESLRPRGGEGTYSERGGPPEKRQGPR